MDELHIKDNRRFQINIQITHKKPKTSVIEP